MCTDDCPRRKLPRFLFTTAAALTLTFGLSTAASAHVTVNPQQAVAGSYAELTFRVPNEMSNAATTKLQVFLPLRKPISSVLIKPHPGWNFHVKTVRLTHPVATTDGSLSEAVSQITWTANSPASAVKPGEFDEFSISAGPLPASGSMEFKALQTYSNGQVVRWIQSPTPGQPEAAHPAPVLTLTNAAAATAPARQGHGTAALILAIAALVIALGGTGFSLLRRPRR